MATYQLSDIDWFEWNGVKCTDYGMHVLSQPTYTSAAEKVSTVDIPGRSGSLTLIEGTDIYSAINLSCSCVIDEKCTSKKGNTLYGTAALLHRICGNKEIEDAFDEEAYKKELYELLIECGYTTREDLYPEEYVEEYVPSRRSRETR